MVRLIGAAVNEGDRPRRFWPAETNILVKATARAAMRPHRQRRSTKQFVAATL